MPLSTIARHRIYLSAVAVREMQPKPDPLLGVEFSALHSRLGSAIKRDGHILADVLTEALQASPYLSVWSRPRIVVSDHADVLADGGYDACHNVDLPHRPNIGRPVCPDIVLLDHRTGRAVVAEVKRGSGYADAGKKRSTLRDLLAARMQIRGWIESQGFRVEATDARVTFIYGTPELHRIDRRLSLFRPEFDDYFQIPVSADLDEARGLFRELLLADRDQLLVGAA